MYPTTPCTLQHPYTSSNTSHCSQQSSPNISHGTTTTVTTTTCPTLLKHARPFFIFTIPLKDYWRYVLLPQTCGTIQDAHHTTNPEHRPSRPTSLLLFLLGWRFLRIHRVSLTRVLPQCVFSSSSLLIPMPSPFTLSSGLGAWFCGPLSVFPLLGSVEANTFVLFLDINQLC